MAKTEILWNIKDLDLNSLDWRSEFYSRELNLTVLPFDPRRDGYAKHEVLIYVDYGRIDDWINFLHERDNGSVSIFFVGNEYYFRKKFEVLNSFPSIKQGYIQYLPPITAVPLVQLLRELKQDLGIVFARPFFGTLFRAMIRFKDLKQLELNFPHTQLPLGYTNRFFKELSNLGLIKDETNSLYGEDFEKYIYSSIDRHQNSGISFFGQKGTWLRRRLVQSFSKEKNMSIRTYGSWGGVAESSRTDYVEEMLNSRYVLCPPGNVSNESFRYYEAIAVGALPIVGETSIQDWVTFDYWPRHFGFKHQTAKDLWKKLKLLKYEEFVDLSKEVRRLEKKKLAAISELLQR